VDSLNRFSIPFAGLTTGSHQFEFEIDDKFFEAFENSVINHAKVHVDLDFNKAETVLTLTFRLKGSIHLVCDRCLGEFDSPVDTTQVMLVRFGEPGVGETDDIIVISHNDSHLDIAQHIYDYLSLQVPIRVVHPDNEAGDSGCDPEFLEKLMNEEREKESIDPRWEILKSLSKRKN
jgi:uncharacterized protein